MSNNSYLCKKCSCGCMILSNNCLIDCDSRISAIDIQNKPELRNMTDSFMLIGVGEENGIIGEKCFNELCDSIKESQQLADDYNKENVDNTSDEGSMFYYLPEKWNLLISNRYFNNMYSAYVMYYYYMTQADSRPTKDGDVKTSKGTRTLVSDSSKGDFITTKHSNDKAAVQFSIASNYKSLFINNFLKKNLEKYSCLNKKSCCGCLSHDRCSCSKNKSCSTSKVSSKPRSAVL